MRLAPLLAVLALLCGCASTTDSRSAYNTLSESERNPALCQKLTAEAVAMVGTDPSEAENLLRQALAADIYHGPAHNNLGVLHLAAGRQYEAAQEFQWAARLMPGHPDPRMNLALTFERAGRTADALAQYQTALEVFPGHLPSTQALTRCQLRYGKPDDRTDTMLREIALAGDTPQWRSWAKEWLIRRSEE